MTSTWTAKMSTATTSICRLLVITIRDVDQLFFVIIFARKLLVLHVFALISEGIFCGMAIVQPVSNKVTLWQGFSTFGGQIDMIAIYEPTHLKVVIQLCSSTKDLISVEFLSQQVRLVTRESGYRQTCGGNRTSCWSEETKRSLWIPFPTNPKLAQWEENNNILSVSVPWLSV